MTEPRTEQDAVQQMPTHPVPPGAGPAEHMPPEHSLFGPLADVAGASGYEEHPPRVGFFTDTSVCIGCKACEVACKEWNLVPDDGFNLLGMSYDNTGMLGANSWRHVAFIEQPVRPGRQKPAFEGLPTGASGSEAAASTVAEGLNQLPERGAELGDRTVDLGMPSFELPGRELPAENRQDFRWLMASDVCKHCTHAGCLDVCPTGALFRTEFGTVVVQQDVCNGCGYCVSGCPYGVIERREGDGRAWKCTLCYDRLHGGLEPACAKACPTDSIQFGELDELRERAHQRVEQLHEKGVTEARLYGESPDDGVGGQGSIFLLLDEPEVYGLPPDPVVPTRDLARMYKIAALAGAAMLGAIVTVFQEGRRR
jgi:formate dehydrogenase iron-sulfur subunit